MRSLLVVLLIVGLVGLMALGPRWLGTRGDTVSTPAELPGENEQLPCRPLAETCTWQVAAGTAAVSMTPLEQNEFLLELELPESPEQVVMILVGVSMYMGEYPMRMQQDTDGHYRTTFVPPFCSTGPEMVWRMTFEVDGRRLETGPGIVFSPSETTSP